ncbi:MAG TPA: glycosyltransferase family 4 protein [Actinomycetota bacterium]|nr:glycosyltransferase family 4 protein [Actinomycetota bacterium]
MGRGGIGSYVRVMAKILAARGHQVHVLSCAEDQERADYVDGCVTVHRRPVIRGPVPSRIRRATFVRRSRVSLSCWVEFRRLGLEADVVEAPEWMAEGLLLSALSGVPSVVTLHGPLLALVSARGREPRWPERVSIRMERAAVRRADLVTAPSRLLVEDLIQRGWLRADDVRIVRNPVDSAQWVSCRPVTETDPVILVVGRVEAVKNPEVVLRAAASLTPSVPGVRVVFLGRSSGMKDGVRYEDWIRSLARELRVDSLMMGEVDPEILHDWYSRARVVVVPSRFDNFPTVALEAMAAGRPVVCSDRTGVADLIGPTEAGAVFTSGDHRELAAKLVPYLRDAQLAARSGTAGRRLVENQCSPEQVAKAREQCYAEAIERRFRGASLRARSSSARTAMTENQRRRFGARHEAADAR